MSRYYKIRITKPGSTTAIAPPGFSAALLGDATYTSFVNGRTLPNAWNVEIDLPVIDAGTSQGFSFARIWGISLQEIAQANDLAGNNIEIYGGMQKGLPLANPDQSGLLVSGNIFQAFGNWISTDMTLDMVIAPGQATGASTPGGIGTTAKPRNITLNWEGGNPLGPALKSALETAFPGFTINVNVSDKIVRPQGDTPSGFYSTLEQLSRNMRAVSRSIVNSTGYQGITIVPYGTTIEVFDGSVAQQQSTTIAFQDMIGQPTWIESPNIQVKTVMRADLKVGSKFTLPQVITTNSQQALSSLVNQRSNFQGGFEVVSLRHVGNFRQASADAWVTVIEGTPQQGAT